MKISNVGLKIFGMCLAISLFVPSVKASIKTDLPKSSISDTFPSTYTAYINKLKKVYPNANFKAVYTGLNWNTVVKHECYEVNKRISTIPKSYPNTWKMNGQNVYIDGSFVAASKSAVAYVLDPRNSLYEREVFQFEGLTYNEHIPISVVEKVMVNSPLVGTYEKKYKNAGKWIDMEMSYAEIVNKVGKEQNVSSVYIASRMIQETSGDIVNNGSINGSNTKYPGVYNFFNIGATPNADGTGSVTNGLKYASSQGWTTPYLSITGGVKEIKSSYIKYGQDTVYFQKFDVNNPYGNASALMAYQYQTNIMAPISESRISYAAYKKLDMLSTAFTFYIPVYNNMPEDPTPYPAGDTAKFDTDNTKVYLDDNIKNGTDVFNVRSSANSEIDNVIYTVTEKKEGKENRTVMTRTKKGNGYDWDYIEINVDSKIIKGYVWSDYVKEYDYVKVENVTLDKSEITLELDETCTLTATILPTNAKYKGVEWTTNNDCVKIENGKITANKLGEAIVTVKTTDQEKITTCKVTVIPKTYAITLDKQEYIVEIDDYVTPKVTLKNLTEYKIEVKDQTIAKVEDYKIKGLKVGETTIVVKSDLNDTKAEAKLVVTDEVLSSYSLDETLKLADKILTGIVPETTVKTFKEKVILKAAELQVINSSNKTLTDADYIGTDCKVVITKQDKTKLEELTICILGDVTGDGKINSADLLKIVKYLKKTTTINFN